MTSYYYTLITSLPKHDRNFKVKETPISRIQLEKRLKLLTKEEQALLKEIEFLLWQSWFSPNFSFKETVLRTKKLLSVDKQPFIKEIIYWYLDLRSLFAALRLRKTQSQPPSNFDDWFGSLNMRLMNHWNDPDFGLRYVYSWLPEVNKMIANNETPALENILLTQIWKHLDIIECRHYFDFEALIIYLMRWNVVNYWSKFNEKMATARINQLVSHALKMSNMDAEMQNYIDESNYGSDK